MLFYLFWLMLFVVFYTYVGYAILVAVLVKIRGKDLKHSDQGKQSQLPSIVHLIAAYNEEDYIDGKITNSLNLTYPKDRYEVWVVTDGSSDKTPEIVGKRKEVRHFHLPERRGKIHAVNRVMKEITSDIVVFSDANTEINQDGLLTMIRHFDNPKVAVVAGEKRIKVSKEDEATSSGEGFYWKYESFLKRYDYFLYSCVGAAGELFSIRTGLFEPVPEDTIIEDFYLSLNIASRGYRIAYEPEAYAMESSSSSIEEESKRKIRIAAGGLQAIFRLRKLFNIFKYRWLSFQFISHRVLRWTLAPLFLPLILLTNVILVLGSSGIFLKVLLVLQVLFYALALLGYFLQSIKMKRKFLFIPFYFVFMNWSVYLGLRRILFGKQTVLWERASRKL